MTAHRIDVPPLVRQRALANGAAGRRWLEALPGVAAELAERWGLTLGAPYSGGTASYVVAAIDASGRPCVLKVGMPLDMHEVDAFRRSVTAHELAAGRGCATLLASDPVVPAMLLERLGPNLHDLGLPTERVLEVVAATLRTFWRPVPRGCPLPTAVDQAAWLARFIEATWDEVGRPCSRAVVDRALALCDERAAAFDPDRSVLVHGDAHGWNTLDAGAGVSKLVDPEGLRSDPAHDLGILMREYNEPLLAGDTPRLVRGRAEELARWCDADPDAVWQWGFIERVSTGLANVRDFDGAAGSAFLEVAARCL